MLCTLWGSCASLVILLPPPPPPTIPMDLTSCFACTSGNTGGPHDWSQPTQRGGPTPSSSISVCIRLVETQLPFNWRKAKLPPLYPGMVTVAPGGVPATLLSTGVLMYHPGGRFSLANKVQECIYVNTEKVLYCWNNTKQHTLIKRYIYCSSVINTQPENLRGENKRSLYSLKGDSLVFHQ